MSPPTHQFTVVWDPDAAMELANAVKIAVDRHGNLEALVARARQRMAQYPA